MANKSDFASALALFTPFEKPQPEDIQSYLSVINSIRELDWAAWTAYKSAGTAEARAARAEEIQSNVKKFKKALKVDGCPPGYHPEGDRCVPDNLGGKNP
jgi:hypothetical protein